MPSARPDRRIKALAIAVLVAIAGCGSGETRTATPTATGPRFVPNGDGTVTDQHTRLQWAANDQGGQMSWRAAEKYADEFTAGGHEDWRLPTLAELQSLYDPELPGYVPVCTRTDLRVKLPDSIRVSCGVAWTDEHDIANATHFNVFYGRHFSVNRDDEYTEGSVALPVRGPLPGD